jgi:hypothetical protein
MSKRLFILKACSGNLWVSAWYRRVDPPIPDALAYLKRVLLIWLRRLPCRVDMSGTAFSSILESRNVTVRIFFFKVVPSFPVVLAERIVF